MLTIRQANATDIPWLLGQLVEFDRFFGAGRSLIPRDGAVEKLASFMNPEVGCFYVAENGQRLGFIAGLLTPHFLNPDIRTLSEILWWVAPEHRGSSAGARLLAAYIEYGNENADWVTMTLETNSPVNPATLERRGFKLHERSYLLEVAQCSSTITAEPAGYKPEWCAGGAV